eukprot:COSAG01_NODE_22211_length_866_cov_2.195567_2_plen_207_part_01
MASVRLIEENRVSKTKNALAGGYHAGDQVVVTHGFASDLRLGDIGTVAGPAENNDNNDVHLRVNVQFSSTGKCSEMLTKDIRKVGTKLEPNWRFLRSQSASDEDGVLFTLDIDLPTKCTVPLVVREGIQPVDAAAAFVTQHGLGQEAVLRVQQTIEQHIRYRPNKSFDGYNFMLRRYLKLTMVEACGDAQAQVFIRSLNVVGVGNWR